MVERIESTGLDEFEGIVESVQLESGIEDRKQYHVTIDATNVEIAGATGKLHEWIPVSSKSTEEAVQQGSVLDRYLTQIEICLPAAKKAKTVEEAFGMMNGKKFKFRRLKHGKDYDGNKAREYMTPVQLLE